MHGGAGDWSRLRDAPEQLEAIRHTVHEVLVAGLDGLRVGGSALDAVTDAVAALEDCGRFNAGRGSVPTTAGTIEMDAGVMDGGTLAAGAVAVVGRVKHPVRAARALLDAEGGTVFLAGSAADGFALERGVEEAPDGWFRPVEPARARQGTVGAVALDRAGHLGAAVSTGGIRGQPPGRVGDSPIPGAGFWAEDGVCAIAATGRGEALMLGVFAHRVARLVAAGTALADACGDGLVEVGRRGGEGGAVALGRDGLAVAGHSTPGMVWGWAGEDAPVQLAVPEPG